MQSRLQNYLKNHESFEKIKELEVKLDETKQAAEETPLQLAIQDGRLDVVLWLLEKNVKIFPIQETIALRHPLIAAILASCYQSNKNSSLSFSVVTEAVFFYASRENARVLLERVLPNVVPSSALIELVLANRQFDIAHQFFSRTKNETVVRHEPGIHTAAYFALLNGLPAWERYCKTDEDWTLTLSQLQHTEKFNQALHAAGTDRQNKLFLSDFKLNDENLNERQQFAYRIAASGSSNANKYLQSARLSLSDYSCIFLHSYHKQNYVALKSILDGCHQHMDLLKNLIREGQNDAAIFLIVGVGIDLYDFVISCENDHDIIKKLITMCWNMEGLLMGLVSRSILPETGKNVLSTVKAIIVNNKINIEPLFQEAVNQFYQIHLNLKEMGQLSDEHYHLVSRLGSRLGMRIKSVKEDFIADLFPVDDMLDIILGYCNDDDKSKLKTLSYQAQLRLETKSLPSNFYRQNKMKQLTMEIELLNKFVTTVTSELGSKRRYNNLGQLLGTCEWACWIASGLALITGLTFIIQGSRNVSDQNVGSITFGPFDIVIGVIITAFASIFFHGSLSTFRREYNQQQPQRFNDLPVNSFSSAARSAANNMFSEFKMKGTLFNPFINHNASSRVVDVLTIARDTQSDYQAKLASLSNLPQQQGNASGDDDLPDNATAQDNGLSDSRVIDDIDENSLTTPLLGRHRARS